MAPELPDPSFAKIVILTGSEEQREALIARARSAAAHGLAPAARIRVTKLVFGPYSHFPVSFRVMGPEEGKVRDIAEKLRTVMLANKGLRQVNTDWSERAPAVHFVLDQDRLHAMGLSSHDAALQLQFLLTGLPVTTVREDIRQVDVVARSAGTDRLDPAKLHAFTLQGTNGQRVPLDQIGHMEIREENPIMHRRDRLVTITLQGDVADELQPPDVANQVIKDMAPLVKSLPAGYRIETGSALEEATKANVALAAVFPVMFILMMVVIIFQVRSMSAMAMVLLTAPLALVGVVPTLLIFHQPFGFNTILGVIALAGIIMRNTLILIGQIHANEHDGYSPYHAVVEATVQRARPVILTALAAVLAFIPLTFSVFWGSLAYTLIGGTLGGTVLTLVFLPALYALWFKIRPPEDEDTSAAPHIDHAPWRNWCRPDPAAWPARSSLRPPRVGHPSFYAKDLSMTASDPVVIAAAARTPLGRYLGDLSPLTAPALGSRAIAAVIERTGLDPAHVDEVIMGCVLPAGHGQAPARQAARAAGLPDATGATTINKVCGSGMKAAMLAHDLILAGSADIIVAGGMESMSNAPYLLAKARAGYRVGHDRILDHMMLDGLEDAYAQGRPMGDFGEATAQAYGFTRDEQDLYASTTLTRARTAIESGAFAAEIVPVDVPAKGGALLIEHDEHAMKVSPDKIPHLKPAFRPDGTITAASASANADGAAALLLMRRSEAERRGLAVLAEIKGHATHSQEPAWYTTAPAPSIEKLLGKLGWSVEQVDLFEINEAFAVVPMAAARTLGIPYDKLNVNGGACALGHPIGATGARLIVTLLHALKARGLTRGVASLCIGGGEATSIGIEIPQL
jgi:acetyl-CoA acetyltransferase family protein